LCKRTYLAAAGAVAVCAAGMAALVVLAFLAVCLTALCLATVLGAAVLLAVVAAGAAAGAPVWANTGSVSADNRAATMMADDFMMVSFLGQAIF